MAARVASAPTTHRLLLLHTATTARVRRPRTRATRAMASSPPPSSPLPTGPVFFMDAFVARQWAAGGAGPDGAAIDPATCSMAAFCDRLHAAHASGTAPLVDGYAPFCKHVFLPNWIPGLKPGAVAITPSNAVHLRTAYTRRRPEELAVLARFFPASSPPALSRPDAAWLDVILYSRDQLAAEAAALPAADRAGRVGEDGAPPSHLPPWGVISVKAQDVPSELPMQPITMLRNALGREEGGSGVRLDREAYEASVTYWSAHAAVVDG